jgi:hypothetical protein
MIAIDLHQLGWFGFQELCLTIARETLGQTTMSFIPTKDAGMDGFFSGKWVSNGTSPIDGQFVLQCKFTSGRDSKLTLSNLTNELPKVRALVEKGICDVYIILTNAGLTGYSYKKILVELQNCGVKHVHIFGSEWIVQQIRENKRLRRMVPRVYGLGDLSEILDERVYSQGRVLLESLRSDLAKVVITGAYRRAAEAIDKHGFVLLIGEPAAGKTTIASLLAVGAIDQWEANTMKLATAHEVIEHWNPDHPNQFFWIDDAFGVTQYESNLVHEWNHQLAHVRAMLSQGCKIVMTSRDYIYSRARKDLKVSAFPMVMENQVVIDVHDLTLMERRQILYNHLKMGEQSSKFKTDIKPHLESVAKLDRFVPEAARRLATPLFTSKLYLSPFHLEEFVNRQESFLVEVIDQLDSDNLAALALIYMNRGGLPSPIILTDPEALAIVRIGSTLGGCTTALSSLTGSLVQTVSQDNGIFWKFRHPTIGDAFSKFIVQSQELIEIYLRGAPVSALIENVTCGDMGLEKAVIVPKSYFPIVMDRLAGFTNSDEYKSSFLGRWGAKWRLYSFLAIRCSREFLIEYLTSNGDVLKRVSAPGLYLDSVSEVDLAFTLHKHGLLPEEHRIAFVQTVQKYALDGDDLSSLTSKKIKFLMNGEELLALRKNIVATLVPKLPDLIDYRILGYSSDEEPEDHVRHLKEVCSILEREFGDDASILSVVEAETLKLSTWIENNEKDSDIPERELLTSNAPTLEQGERSIFDDVDS